MVNPDMHSFVHRVKNPENILILPYKALFLTLFINTWYNFSMVKEKLQSLGGGDWEDQLAKLADKVNPEIIKKEEGLKNIDLLRKVPLGVANVYEDNEGNLATYSNEKPQKIAIEDKVVNNIKLNNSEIKTGSKIHINDREEIQIDGIATDGDHNLVYYRTIKKSPMGDVKISDSKKEAEFIDMISSKGGVLIKDYTAKTRGEDTKSATLNEQHGSSNEQPKSDTIVTMVKETPKTEPEANPVNDAENFSDTKKEDIESLLDEHKKYLNNKFNNAKTEDEKLKLEKKIKYFNDSPYTQLKSNIEYSIKNLEEKIENSKTKGEGNALKKVLSRLQAELALIDEAIEEEKLKKKEDKKTVKPKGDAENATRKVDLRPMIHTLKTPDGSVYELRDLNGAQVELFKAILSDIETSQISREEIIALNERMDDEVKLPEKSLTDLLYAFDIKNPKKETGGKIDSAVEQEDLQTESNETKLENLEKELSEIRTERDTLMANYNTRAKAREEEIKKLENELKEILKRESVSETPVVETQPEPVVETKESLPKKYSAEELKKEIEINLSKLLGGNEGGESKIKNVNKFDVKQNGNSLILATNVTAKTGNVLKPTVTFDMELPLESKDGTLAIGNYIIDAGILTKKVKAEIEPKLKELIPGIKKYFESKEGKQIDSINIENGNLVIKYK